MMRVVLEQRLGFVATVTPDGRPNVSPKGTTTVLDDEHLLFADIASPGTVTNLASSPFVEVNVLDPIRRKGYRFKGRGEVHRGGEQFEHGWRCWSSVATRHPARGSVPSSSSMLRKRRRSCRPSTQTARRRKRSPRHGSSTTAS